jgi:hypothetical protein
MARPSTRIGCPATRAGPPANAKLKHNSALHPLDDAAKYFFASLKSFLEHDTA